MLVTRQIEDSDPIMTVLFLCFIDKHLCYALLIWYNFIYCVCLSILPFFPICQKSRFIFPKWYAKAPSQFLVKRRCCFPLIWHYTQVTASTKNNSQSNFPLNHLKGCFSNSENALSILQWGLSIKTLGFNKKVVLTAKRSK